MAEDTFRLIELCKAHASFLYPEYRQSLEILTARHDSTDQFYAVAFVRLYTNESRVFRKGPHSQTRNGALQAFLGSLEQSLNNVIRKQSQGFVKLDSKEWTSGFKLRIDSDTLSMVSQSASQSPQTLHYTLSPKFATSPRHQQKATNYDHSPHSPPGILLSHPLHVPQQFPQDGFSPLPPSVRRENAPQAPPQPFQTVVVGRSPQQALPLSPTRDQSRERSTTV